MADRHYPPMVQELGLRCSWVAPTRRFVYALTGVLLAGPVSESVRARSLASLSSRLSPALRSFTEGGLQMHMAEVVEDGIGLFHSFWGRFLATRRRRKPISLSLVAMVRWQGSWSSA
jgi:hypothetical protein